MVGFITYNGLNISVIITAFYWLLLELLPIYHSRGAKRYSLHRGASSFQRPSLPFSLPSVRVASRSTLALVTKVLISTSSIDVVMAWFSL